jgi:hypothetical protein
VDAKSSLGDAKSSLGDAKELSLGDAKSSLGEASSPQGPMSTSVTPHRSGKVRQVWVPCVWIPTSSSTQSVRCGASINMKLGEAVSWAFRRHSKPPLKGVPPPLDGAGMTEMLKAHPRLVRQHAAQLTDKLVRASRDGLNRDT